MQRPVSDADLLDVKKEARKAAFAAREMAHRADHGRAGAALAMTGLGFLGLPAAAVISGFLPYQTEIDVRPLMARLAAAGHVTCLPVVTGRGEPLVFRAWRPGEATEPGVWNIPVPPPGAPEVVPDVLLVPLLAFDSAGFRLGYGGGFYDRTLEALRRQKRVIAVGVAYAGQETQRVPHGPHDEPLDWILTQMGARRVGANAGFSR